jgi:heptaprenyl diphosphate synthase
VVDDVLDVVASDDELGKPAGHDVAEGIYNVPVMAALAGPDGDELRAVLGGPLDPEAHARALALVRAGDGVAQATVGASAYVDAALAALDRLPVSTATDALAGAARHLLGGLDGQR